MSEIDRRQLAAGSARLEERAYELRSKLASVESPLPGLLGRTDLAELWESESVEWRQRVAGALIDKVLVRPAVRGRNFFDPDRVEIVPAV